MTTPALVAVAWPYASGSRHHGHPAGAYRRPTSSPAKVGRLVDQPTPVFHKVDVGTGAG